MARIRAGSRAANFWRSAPRGGPESAGACLPTPSFYGRPAAVFKKEGTMTGRDSQKHSHPARHCAWLLLLAAPLLRAGDGPYFVTYTHYMEEPGNLEIAFSNVTARPDGGNRFLNNLVELEYGTKAWWTTELYLHGQTTAHQSTV